MNIVLNMYIYYTTHANNNQSMRNQKTTPLTAILRDINKYLKYFFNVLNRLLFIKKFNYDFIQKYMYTNINNLVYNISPYNHMHIHTHRPERMHNIDRKIAQHNSSKLHILQTTRVVQLCVCECIVLGYRLVFVAFLTLFFLSPHN